MGLISIQSIGIGLGAWAVSCFFGVGELVALGFLIVLGEQALFELTDAIQITALAATIQELDEAAEHVARAIAMAGAVVFVGMLAKVAGKAIGRGEAKEVAAPEPKVERSPPKPAEPAATEVPQSRQPLPDEDAFQHYMKKAESLDVSTKPNEAVFYSGKGNRALAETFAQDNGKTTLEMTPGGKWLDEQGLFGKDSPLTPDQAIKVWSKISQRYAQGASGNVVGFVDGASPGGIFNRIEYDALSKNPNVTNVITGGQ
jgi:hypothetical protein